MIEAFAELRAACRELWTRVAAELIEAGPWRHLFYAVGWKR